jgi:mannose-6-phosphate isomerase-like protein (cupin superfamily)
MICGWEHHVMTTATPQGGAVMTTTPASTGTGHTIAAGEGERLWIVGDTMTFKATGESTGGSLMLLENLTAPGGGPPPHIHTREDEFWYVLDGSFEIRIGDEVHSVGPGGFAYAPRGTVHNFRNTAETPVGSSWASHPPAWRASSGNRGGRRPTTARRRRWTRPRSLARWRPHRSTGSRPSPSTHPRPHPREAGRDPDVERPRRGADRLSESRQEAPESTNRSRLLAVLLVSLLLLTTVRFGSLPASDGRLWS